MQSPASISASSGKSVLVAETGLERLQLVGRAGPTAFLMGGGRDKDGQISGLSPYEMLSASLASCTLMTVRMFAERKNLNLGRIQVAVSHSRDSSTKKDVFERVIALEGKVDDKIVAGVSKIANLCPVGRTLSQSSEIITLVEAAPGSAPSSANTDYVEEVRELEIPNVDW
jgi:putative redox protein